MKCNSFEAWGGPHDARAARGTHALAYTILNGETAQGHICLPSALQVVVWVHCSMLPTPQQQTSFRLENVRGAASRESCKS